MCGICGLAGRIADVQQNIHCMNEHMRDRGPDAEGYWYSKDDPTCENSISGVAMGHRRLSILDLSEQGAQPFTSASGRLTIAFNGEIYNHRQIRERLQQDGHVTAFRSTCDTETLVEAMEAYGIYETLTMCKGMFAIAVYDRKEKCLTLARDRVGEKPLYFGFLDGSAGRGFVNGQHAFVFASDIGAIAALNGFSNPIRRDILPMYFRHGYIPAPYSIYERIWKLYPGTILTIMEPYVPFDFPEIRSETLSTVGGAQTGDGWDLECYYSVEEVARLQQAHPFEGTYDEARTELENRLCSAISDMMVADVPLGAFLSAGIDSPTIAALMQRVNPGKVHTYTIGMEGQYDEAPMAAEIARTLGVNNTQMYITDRDAQDVIPLLPRMFGEPFADSSQIPTYLVSRMTRQHVTVSLSGDAGDELFCGYRSYASLERIWGKIGQYPRGLRRAASGILLHSPIAMNETRYNQAVLLSAGGPLELGRLQNLVEDDAGDIALPCDSGTPMPLSMDEILADDAMPDALHLAMLRDLTMYHPDDILVKVDRTAMAVSLETRVPFLDRDVMDLAWSLPIDYLRVVEEDGKGSTMGGFTGKRILRDILYQYVPRDLMERPKKGFSIPIKSWLRDGDLRDWAEELLNPSRIAEEGYLDSERVTYLWNDFITNGRWRPQIWYILMFESWLKENSK